MQLKLGGFFRRNFITIAFLALCSIVCASYQPFKSSVKFSPFAVEEAFADFDEDESQSFDAYILPPTLSFLEFGNFPKIPYPNSLALITKPKTHPSSSPRSPPLL